MVLFMLCLACRTNTTTRPTKSQTTQSNIPSTNWSCLQRKSLLEPLNLGLCTDSEAWFYNTQQKTITIKGTYFCLQADGLNKLVKLGVICSGSTSK